MVKNLTTKGFGLYSEGHKLGIYKQDLFDQIFTQKNKKSQLLSCHNQTKKMFQVSS